MYDKITTTIEIVFVSRKLPEEHCRTNKYDLDTHKLKLTFFL